MRRSRGLGDVYKRQGLTDANDAGMVPNGRREDTSRQGDRVAARSQSDGVNGKAWLLYISVW